MIKSLSIVNQRENGFFLPYVLFISIVVIIMISYSAYLYRNELIITNHIIEQFTYDSLYQMAVQQFQKDKPYMNNEQNVIRYSFPHGEVTIRYETSEENEMLLDCIVKSRNKGTYKFRKRLIL